MPELMNKIFFNSNSQVEDEDFINLLKSSRKTNIFLNMPKFFLELMECKEIFSFVIEKMVLYFLHLYLHHYLLNKRISFELAVFI